jgi:hypothetical protein
MLASTDGRPTYKVAAHLAHKLTNRKSRWYAFLDLGATSGAAPEEDKQDLNSTGKMSRKTFMFPNARLGNPFGILQNSAINPIRDLLNSGIFIGIQFFRSYNVFPPILNTFFPVRNPLPPSILPFSLIGKCSRYICQWQVASNFDTQRTNSFRPHHCQPTAHNIYLIHTNL